MTSMVKYLQLSRKKVLGVNFRHFRCTESNVELRFNQKVMVVMTSRVKHLQLSRYMFIGVMTSHEVIATWGNIGLLDLFLAFFDMFKPIPFSN